MEFQEQVSEHPLLLILAASEGAVQNGHRIAGAATEWDHVPWHSHILSK
jgi:hypothetical protein